MTSIFLTLLFGLSLFTSIIVCIEYHCHTSFSANRARQLGVRLRETTLDSIREKLSTKRIVKLDLDLFVAEDSRQGKIFLDHWTIVIDHECFQLSVLEYLRYRAFLGSKHMQSLSGPSYQKFRKPHN